MKKMYRNIAIFSVLILLLEQLVSFALVDDVNSYTRVMLHELYENSGEIDIALCGASHVYRGLDPEVISQVTGNAAFNLGSSSQSLRSTYYLLRETINNNPNLSTVFLEISFIMFMLGDTYSLQETNIIYSYMRPSINKLSYFFASYGPDDYIQAIFNSTRFLDNVPRIPEIVENKNNEKYQNYAYPKYANEEYRGRGYVYSTQTYDGVSFLEQHQVWDENQIDMEEIDYLRKCVELCQDKGIDIFLITTPMPMTFIGPITDMFNYACVHDFFSSFAQMHGCIYYDFNLLDEKVQKLTNEDFHDYGHLNGSGATKISVLIGDLYNEVLDGTFDFNRWFYPDFETRRAIWEQDIIQRS